MGKFKINKPHPQRQISFPTVSVEICNLNPARLPPNALKQYLDLTTKSISNQNEDMVQTPQRDITMKIPQFNNFSLIPLGTPHLLTAELVLNCDEYFCTKVYPSPVSPVVKEAHEPCTPESAASTQDNIQEDQHCSALSSSCGEHPINTTFQTPLANNKKDLLSSNEDIFVCKPICGDHKLFTSITVPLQPIDNKIKTMFLKDLPENCHEINATDSAIKDGLLTFKQSCDAVNNIRADTSNSEVQNVQMQANVLSDVQANPITNFPIELNDSQSFPEAMATDCNVIDDIMEQSRDDAADSAIVDGLLKLEQSSDYNHHITTDISNSEVKNLESKTNVLSNIPAKSHINLPIELNSFRSCSEAIATDVTDDSMKQSSDNRRDICISQVENLEIPNVSLAGTSNLLLPTQDKFTQSVHTKWLKCVELEKSPLIKKQPQLFGMVAKNLTAKNCKYICEIENQSCPSSNGDGEIEKQEVPKSKVKLDSGKWLSSIKIEKCSLTNFSTPYSSKVNILKEPPNISLNGYQDSGNVKSKSPEELNEKLTVVATHSAPDPNNSHHECKRKRSHSFNQDEVGTQNDQLKSPIRKRLRTMSLNDMCNGNKEVWQSLNNQVSTTTDSVKSTMKRKRIFSPQNNKPESPLHKKSKTMSSTKEITNHDKEVSQSLNSKLSSTSSSLESPTKGMVTFSPVKEIKYGILQTQTDGILSSKEVTNHHQEVEQPLNNQLLRGTASTKTMLTFSPVKETQNGSCYAQPENYKDKYISFVEFEQPPLVNMNQISEETPIIDLSQPANVVPIYEVEVSSQSDDGEIDLHSIIEDSQPKKLSNAPGIIAANHNQDMHAEQDHEWLLCDRMVDSLSDKQCSSTYHDFALQDHTYTLYPEIAQYSSGKRHQSTTTDFQGKVNWVPTSQKTATNNKISCEPKRNAINGKLYQIYNLLVPLRELVVKCERLVPNNVNILQFPENMIKTVKRKPSIKKTPKKKKKVVKKTTNKALDGKKCRKPRKKEIPTHYMTYKPNQMKTIKRMDMRYRVAFYLWADKYSGALDKINQRLTNQNAFWKSL